MRPAARLTAAQILRADVAKRRADAIATAAAQIAANMSWPKPGPPWANGANGKQTAIEDRRATAKAIRDEWGEAAERELRMAVEALANGKAAAR